MKYAFILAFIFLSLTLHGQDYAITTKGDTITGKIKILPHDFDKGIQVVGANKKKTTLTILQVKSFTQNGERFETVRQANTYSFMKPLREGYLSLYAFQLEKQATYDGLFLVKRDGKSLEVPNLMFKKTVAKFLAECPTVAKEIEEGKLGRNDLDAILDNFNGCIDKNSVQHITGTFVNTDVWDNLLRKLESSSIESKSDAIDMTMEIKNKVNRNERIPKFLIEALSNALSSEKSLSDDLGKALQAVKQ